MYKIFRKSDGVVIQKGDECLPAYIQGVQPYAYKRLVELVKLANEHQKNFHDMGEVNGVKLTYVNGAVFATPSPVKHSPTAKSGKNKKKTSE